MAGKPLKYPTKEYLDTRFSYDPQDGTLKWLPVIGNAAWNSKHVGVDAGKKCKSSMLVRLGDKTYSKGRIIMIMQGVDVTGLDVDHINRNPFDNRFVNLRAVSHHNNTFNRKRTIASRFGYVGVAPSGNNRYISKLQFRGKTFFGGCFDTPQEAAMDRDILALTIHGECAYLNFPRSMYMYTAANPV